MSNFIAAYGDKILMWVIGVCGLLDVPAAGQALHINAVAMAWITVAAAALNLAHGIFYSPSEQQRAKTALKVVVVPPPITPKS